MAHKNHIPCRKTWLNTLAKRHTASGAFIFNEKNQLLILKPSYKDGWNLPGGVTDEFESPYQTIVRECKEETNLDIQIQQLVLVDYITEQVDGEQFDHVEFYFLAQAQTLDCIKIDNEEIIDYKFVDPKQAHIYLPDSYCERLNAILDTNNYPVLFENKKPLK